MPRNTPISDDENDRFFDPSVPAEDVYRDDNQLVRASNIDVATLSFDEIIAELGGELVDIHDLDPRERFDKNDLVNVPFLILKVRVNPRGDYGNPFVVVDVKTASNQLGWFTDGSTGICAQLLELSKRNLGAKPILVGKGLVKSTYETTDVNGDVIQGTTYYLSTAARK